MDLQRLRWIVVPGLAVLAAFVAAFLAAVVLAVTDLYVTGHGHASISRPWISWSPYVELSRADVVLLATTGTAAVVTWLGLRSALKQVR